MALVKLLKGVSGNLRQHNASADSINMADYQIGGVAIGSGTLGATVLTDNSATYTNFTPAGDTIRETLDAIDTLLGTISGSEDSVFKTMTNGEAVTSTAAGDVVCMEAGVNDNFLIASNDNDALDSPIGVVTSAIAAASTGTVIFSGVAEGALVGATAGDHYYLGTSGALTTTVPSADESMVVFIGTALNATDLLVQIDHRFENETD